MNIDYFRLSVFLILKEHLLICERQDSSGFEELIQLIIESYEELYKDHQVSEELSTSIREKSQSFYHKANDWLIAEDLLRADNTSDSQSRRYDTVLTLKALKAVNQASSNQYSEPFRIQERFNELLKRRDLEEIAGFANHILCSAN